MSDAMRNDVVEETDAYYVIKLKERTEPFVPPFTQIEADVNSTAKVIDLVARELQSRQTDMIDGIATLFYTKDPLIRALCTIEGFDTPTVFAENDPEPLDCHARTGQYEPLTWIHSLSEDGDPLSV